MSRKDYILIAQTILNLDCVTEDQRTHVAEQFAAELAKENGAFKSDLFVQAATGTVAINARKAR